MTSLGQTVHTHHASVDQAAKLVAALLRVAGVIVGLVESNGSYRRVYDSPHLQADCQEPGSAPEPCARQSSMGYLYLIVCGYYPASSGITRLLNAMQWGWDRWAVVGCVSHRASRRSISTTHRAGSCRPDTVTETCTQATHARQAGREGGLMSVCW